tara:strand:- start:568 stop:837 length:270 start_codon:yes stop_codon:yes gene_type:complete
MSTFAAKYTQTSPAQNVNEVKGKCIFLPNMPKLHLSAPTRVPLGILYLGLLHRLSQMLGSFFSRSIDVRVHGVVRPVHAARKRKQKKIA